MRIAVFLCLLVMSGLFAATAAAQEVAFKLVHNMILLPVEVNGVKTIGRLDTGGAFSIMHSATAKALGFPTKGVVSATGITGRTMHFGTAPPVTVKIGGYEMKSKDLMLVDLDSMAPGNPNQLGITLGMDLIQDLVMEIDFDRSIIKFTPSSKFTTPPATKPIRFTRVGADRSFIGSVAGWPNVRMDFDMGNPGAIELSDRVAETALAGQRKSQFVSSGVDGKLLLPISTLPSVTLADVELKNVPASVRLRGVVRVGVGLDVLKRFNLVLDFARDRMWMTPNSKLASPYRKNVTGIDSDGMGWPQRVIAVAAGSPAQRAGFQPGEFVTRVLDDAGASIADANDLDELAEGRHLVFELKDGSKRELTTASYY